MASSHSVVRTPTPVERSHGTTPARSVARTPLSPARSVQQRIGNSGTQDLIARAQAFSRTSAPNDAAEREARSTATAVMSMSEPSIGSNGVAVARECVQCKANEAAEIPLELSDSIKQNLHGGQPLPMSVRGFVEPRFGADFSRVRIHTNESAAALSDRLHADAFTVGQHIFFAKGKYKPETPEGRELIAHELTHTVQQGEAVRRDEKKSWWDTLTDFSDSVGWKALETAAPSLVPIIRKGPSGLWETLKDFAGAAVEGVFNRLMAPVRAFTGLRGQLAAEFAPLLVTVQTAAAQIARNDCSPLREAADKLEKGAAKIILPIVQKLQPVVAKIKQVMSDLWDKIGAPIWGWIQNYAAEQWAQVQAIGRAIAAVAGWIWDKTAWVRSLASQAWNWIKNKLGIGDGPDGQDGLLQWVQRKLESAWNEVKTRLEPFKAELKAIGTTLLVVAAAVSPAGPVLAIGAAIYGAVTGLRWIAANWGKGNLIVQARTYLEKTLIPPLLGAAQKLGSSVQGLADSVGKALGSFAGGMVRAVGSLGASALRFAVSAIQWLADQAVALAQWAQLQLGQLAQFVAAAVARLQGFLRTMLNFFKRVADVVIDIWQLPLFLAEGVWNAVPACIRDPIVDFIGPIILKQISIFQELAKNDEAWQKTKADIAKIIKLVFKDRDLMGAVRAAFDLILRVFNVPLELLVEIKRKAIGAWDVISKKPIDFLKNAVRSIGYGFLLLGQNFLEHLQFGVEGWLLGELAEKKISKPKSWTDPKELFFFVLSVLGLTTAHVLDLLKKRIDPGLVDAAQTWIGRFAGAVEFVAEMLDPSRTPEDNTQGIIDRAKDFGKSVLTGVAEWIAAQVAAELALMAAAAAASAGLSEVLDVIRRIYKAIQTAVRWARRILDMVSQVLDTVLDIAAGAIAKVGKLFEGILHKGMPVVIGFLADQVGLGGVGEALRDIVDTLRQKVDEGLMWLIDKVVGFIESILRGIASGVQALVDWWNKKVPLRSSTQPHTLQFDGSGASAVLMVHTKPTPPDRFVEEFVDTEATKAQKKKAYALNDKVAATQAKLVKAQESDDKAAVAALTQQLSDEVDDLGAVLQALMDLDEPAGSEGNPLQIDYPKRAASAYIDIYCGPRTDDVGVSQATLRSLAGRSKNQKEATQAELEQKEPHLKGNKAVKAWDGVVQVFSPTMRSKIDNKPVGLSDEFASLGFGKVLVYWDKFGTGGGGKINDLFRPYGFKPSSEGLDGDHVMERQIGGPDEIENLWPLKASENRSSGSLVKNLKGQYGAPGASGKTATAEIAVHEAKAKRGSEPLYLLIRSVK